MKDLELTISRIVMIFFRITIALVLVTIVYLNLTEDVLATNVGNIAMVLYLFITVFGERLATTAYKESVVMKKEIDELLDS